MAPGRRADRRPGVVRIVEVGGAQIAGRSGRAGVTVVELARLHHRAGHRAGDVGGVVGAVDGDGHQLLGAADREGRKRIGQRLPDIARLHGGIVVVQRVGPDAGLRQRVGAELAPQRRVDGDPEVVGIVDVGGVQIAGRGRGARCAVIDAAGLGHRPGGGAADHWRRRCAVDGDGHQLLGAVRCHRREGVGQRLARIERLHGRIVVVQRVGPQPGGGERVAAVAACGREADLPPRRPDRRNVGIQIPGVGRYARRAVGDTAGLDHRAGGIATDHCRVVGAVDGDGHDLGGAVRCHRREGVDQRIARIERLHGRIGVVQRVGPQPGGGERERAVGACGREADLLPGIVRIVDVGEIEVAGRSRRARRSVGNTAGLDHRAGGFAADHCSVVGAADDDDDDLRSAVDRRDGERIAQYLPDIARLHVRIAVVQRVGPQPGGGERIGAVAFGARGRRADRDPGIARVVARRRWN